jgi:hypothetical protein
MDMAEHEIQRCFRELTDNTDVTMQSASRDAMKYCDTLPNSDYVIHEASPNAPGTGKPPARAGIKQFPGDNAAPQDAGENGDADLAGPLAGRAHGPQAGRLNRG